MQSFTRWREVTAQTMVVVGSLWARMGSLLSMLTSWAISVTLRLSSKAPDNHLCCQGSMLGQWRKPWRRMSCTHTGLPCLTQAIWAYT